MLGKSKYQLKIAKLNQHWDILSVFCLIHLCSCMPAAGTSGLEETSSTARAFAIRK